MLLAGNVLPRGSEEAEVVPNITPEPDSGIGRWSRNDIAHYLRTGSRPDGGLAQSLMAGLIFSSFSHLTRTEALAIATYLKSIPPVRHRPEQPAREAGTGSASADARGVAVHLGRPLLSRDSRGNPQFSSLRP
jgi:hypothetical protein